MLKKSACLLLSHCNVMKEMKAKIRSKGVVTKIKCQECQDGLWRCPTPVFFPVVFFFPEDELVDLTRRISLLYS